jgi:hypothetical protein
MMNIFYNSPHYVIVAYPLQQGLELVDKIGQSQPVRSRPAGA